MSDTKPSGDEKGPAEKGKTGKLPKIGKRGWVGIIIFAWGAFGFLTASSTANLLVNTPLGPDAGINAAVSSYYNGLGKDLGYDSTEDYLTAKYRKNGGGEMLVGAGFIGWGFWKYGRKKIDGEDQQTPKTDKSAS